MRGDGGYALVELLVASSCMGLLAAGVLGLMVNTADTVRDRMMRLDATMRAERCAEQLARDLRRATRGLETRAPLITVGGLVEVIEPAATGVTLALARSAPVEVDERANGTYRVAGSGVLAVGMRVAAIGLAGDAPAVPLAVVVGVARVSSERLVEVAWNASQQRILQQHGPTRALVPLVSRTYQTRSVPAGEELRRRDDDGSWQPVVDGLAAVEIDYGLAGVVGVPLLSATELQLRAAELPSRPAAVVVARIDCAVSTGVVLVHAVQWAGIGRR